MNTLCEEHLETICRSRSLPLAFIHAHDMPSTKASSQTNWFFKQIITKISPSSNDVDELLRDRPFVVVLHNVEVLVSSNRKDSQLLVLYNIFDYFRHETAVSDKATCMFLCTSACFNIQDSFERRTKSRCPQYFFVYDLHNNIQAEEHEDASEKALFHSQLNFFEHLVYFSCLRIYHAQRLNDDCITTAAVQSQLRNAYNSFHLIKHIDKMYYKSTLQRLATLGLITLSSDNSDVFSVDIIVSFASSYALYLNALRHKSEDSYSNLLLDWKQGWMV